MDKTASNYTILVLCALLAEHRSMLACTSDAVAIAHLILGQQCSRVTRAFTGAKACEAFGCYLCLSILILLGQLTQLVV